MQPQLTTTPRKLPVFVFPQSITFYLDDQSTHKQVLTLYNPYDFPVKFKVLCTAPNKYKVVDPEGTIKARCCVDIVVRHTALLIANCNATDKFRIQMQEHPSKQVMGKRDVEARLLNGTSETTGRATPDHEMFQQLPTNENRQQQSYTLLAQNRAVDRITDSTMLLLAITEPTSKIFLNAPNVQYHLFKGPMRKKSVHMLLHSNSQDAQYIIVDKEGTNYVALIAGIICIAALLLPTEGERNHRVPDYLHLSINFKLIFSFVLGMVTIIVLRL